MDDVSEYIQLEEQRKEREALRQSMGDVFAFWPEPEADLFLTMLSDPSFNEDHKKKLLAFIKEKGIIDNETVMANTFSNFVGFKTIAHAVQAAHAAKKILNVVPDIVQGQVNEFKDSVIDIAAHVVAEIENAVVPIVGLKDDIKEGVGIIETAYKERSAHIEARAKNAMSQITTHADSEIVRISTEIEKRAKEIELTLTEKAVKEFRKAIVPAIAKAIGWRGLLCGIGVLTAAMFLHDFLLKIFH